MIDVITEAKRAVARFINTCGCDYEFPSGGRIELLNESESALFAILQSDELSTADKINIMSDGLDWSNCYSIVILGVRLAILGVRTTNITAYRCGILAFVAGGPKIDWRDLLGVLAILENCADRLDVSFQIESEKVLGLTNDAKMHSIVGGYFSRPDEMRSVDVMGFIAVGGAHDLTFKPKES